jgi:LuxR family maltose regulon positive regulatory protein
LLAALEHQLRFESSGATERRVTELREKAGATRIAGSASWPLTSAELRVLHYLPTNLSLSDIAARLYVSRNTVKSHAASVYRKLGATSRGRAVEAARAAGLLDESDRPTSE